MEQLGEAGIETRPFFYPMHQLPPYNDKENAIREFPVADKISSLGLNLPTSSAFSVNDIRQISNTLLEVVSRCLSVVS
jgi:perosamine synthetase